MPTLDSSGARRARVGQCTKAGGEANGPSAVQHSAALKLRAATWTSTDAGTRGRRDAVLGDACCMQPDSARFASFALPDRAEPSRAYSASAEQSRGKPRRVGRGRAEPSRRAVATGRARGPTTPPRLCLTPFVLAVRPAGGAAWLGLGLPAGSHTHAHSFVHFGLPVKDFCIFRQRAWGRRALDCKPRRHCETGSWLSKQSKSHYMGWVAEARSRGTTSPSIARL